MTHRGWNRQAQPGWWPEGETWPPRQDMAAHRMPTMAKRFMRYVAGLVFMVLFLPVAIVLILAGAVGGWSSVAVAAISWIALLLLFVIAGRYAFRLLRPIQQLIVGTERLADGDYAARVTTEVTAPFRPVATSFNRMAERLQTAEDLRRRLLADVSHELRTPLTVLRGELEAMLDGVHQLDESQIGILLGDVAVMERLLDDLRTLSTSEAGVLTLHTEPTDTWELAQDMVDRFQGEAVQRNVLLTLEGSPSESSSAREADLDPVRIGEVLSNLITNALRAATPAGKVTLRSRLDEKSSPTIVVFEVIDTGTGVDPTDIDRVFDRFHKGPDSSGSGLGLTISRALVEAHGGSIHMKSRRGEGTVVTVRVPLLAPPA